LKTIESIDGMPTYVSELEGKLKPLIDDLGKETSGVLVKHGITPKIHILDEPTLFQEEVVVTLKFYIPREWMK
jgi:hypothetical protein